MLGPYRDPGPVAADPLPEPLPDRCITAPQGCFHRPPPAGAPAPVLLLAYAKALAAAATLLFLAATASVSASAWVATSKHLDARAQQKRGPASKPGAVQEQAARWPKAVAAPPRPPARRPIQERSAVPLPPRNLMPSALAALGPEAHDVETLWQRALKEAARGGPGALTPVRVTAAPGTVTFAPEAISWIRQPGGFRILDTQRPEGSLLGLRTGDVVTGVNGFAMRRAEDAAFAQLAMGGNAVVELTRAGKRVVLRVDWAR